MLKLSPVHQVLVEKSVRAYEIEFEVMRGSTDHAITICGMKDDIDPLVCIQRPTARCAPSSHWNDHDHPCCVIALENHELKIKGGRNVVRTEPHPSEYY